MKLTPALIVDEIEKSLPFWMERLGFAKTVEVPEGPRLAFVILVKDGAELMLQTRESIRKDAPATLPPEGAGITSLFVVVEDFDDLLKRIEGCEIILPERTTWYGMREIAVREPSGHTVVFAMMVPK